MGQKSQWGSAKSDNLGFDKPAGKKNSFNRRKPLRTKALNFYVIFSLICTYMVLGKKSDFELKFCFSSYSSGDLSHIHTQPEAYIVS